MKNLLNLKSQYKSLEISVINPKNKIKNKKYISNCFILFKKIFCFISFILIYLFILLFIIHKKITFYNNKEELKKIINSTKNETSQINNDSFNINSKIKIDIINKTIISNDTSDYYKSDEEKFKAFNKGRRFFELCFKGKLINKENFTKSNNPFISVVIPVYNSDKNIEYVIRSVQNQNITNLEIVLVNDNSKDNSKNIIEKMQNEDPRIILINNTKNMGTLYSRCIGTLLSKGKYIFPLDNDDFFLDEGVLDIVSQEAEKGNFDIVEFIGAEYQKYGIIPNFIKNSEYTTHKNNLILYQPELGKYPRFNGTHFGVFDVFLWGKCIKSEVYKKTIYLLGFDIYSQYIIWGEDLITSYVLFRVAKSFKFIRKYGIFRYKNKETASSNTPVRFHHLSHILYCLVLLKFPGDSSFEKKYLVQRSIKTIKSFLKFKQLDGTVLKFLKKFLEEIMNSKYINNDDKKIINGLSQNVFQKNKQKK